MINITFKLFASLTDYLPTEGRQGQAVPLVIEPTTTIGDLIERYRLPLHLVHLVLVNGVYIAKEDRGTRTLVEGDVLAMWPPIAGG